MTEVSIEDNSNALGGLRVLVTRPLEQGGNLCRLIEALGGAAIHVPALDILPTDGPIAKAILARSKSCDWLVFISANAVRYALALGGGELARGKKSRIAAIGKATARALTEAGIEVDLIPTGGSSSEDLLAMPEMHAVSKTACMIIRGEGGREILAETLVGRGALVLQAEVYRRAKPSADAAVRLLDELRRGGIDMVTVASGETLDNLLELIGPTGFDFLRNCPLVVVSERIRQYALSLGLERVRAATDASDAALVAALSDCAGTLRHRNNDGE